MELSTALLATVLALVAAAGPFALRFDQGGLAGMAVAERGKRILFAVMSLLFGTGFVALAAAGTGALLGIEGIAAMIPLSWLWAPILLASTAVAARRGFRGRPA